PLPATTLFRSEVGAGAATGGEAAPPASIPHPGGEGAAGIAGAGRLELGGADPPALPDHGLVGVLPGGHEILPEAAVGQFLSAGGGVGLPHLPGEGVDGLEDPA